MKDYTNIGAVCFDCARKAGFSQKKKSVIVRNDECGICHARKPCTDLHHDWMPPKTMKLRMIFCYCMQVGERRYSDRYYTKDIELSGAMSDFVRKHNEDFVGVELLDEETQKEKESEAKE